MSDGQQMGQGQGVQVGRDFYGTVNMSFESRVRISFAELSVDELERETRPPDAECLATLVRERGLVVIETVELNHRVIARQVASSLHDQLRGQRSAIRIREWDRGDGMLDVDAELKHCQETQILVLPGAGRNNFGDDLLANLANRLRRYGDGHFAILTTEFTREEWQVRSESEEKEPFWQSRTRASYYTDEFLCDLLNKELKPFEEPISTLLGGLSLDEVVQRLGDPARIRGFGLALRDHGPGSPEEVRSLIDRQIGDRQAVQRWFRNLDEREQLLAVGLILFNDLPADQVFAGVESLVEEVWRPNQPLLAHFDYRDVEPLRRCFEQLPGGTEEGRIAITVENRRWLFEIAWRLHRRRILASLPAVAEMVKNAAAFLDSLGVDPKQVEAATQPAPPEGTLAEAPKPQERADRKVLWRMSLGRARELYGTVRRMAGLQRAAADSLSEIGCISYDAIEPCLRELAAVDSPGVRLLVAEALAASRRWKTAPGCPPRLFSMLLEWWTDACRLDSWRPDPRRLEKDATRAAIALTVGSAAGYDPPSQMADALVGLFRQLIDDRAPAVRGAFEGILPEVLARHLRQLEQQVSGPICRQADLLEAAAFGVAKAYALRPGETRQVLATWRSRAGRKESPAAEGAASDEMLLSLVARSLGYLWTRDEDRHLPPPQVFSELRSILVESRHPLVRHHTLVAAGIQALRNYEQAAPLLVDLLAEVTLEDRAIVVGVFVNAYLQQRRHLTGGEAVIQIGGDSYPIWYSTQRPLTAIEEALFLWLQQWDQPVAQQIATESFAAVAATGLDVEERRAAAGGGAPATTLPGEVLPAAVATAPVLLRALGPLGWLALRMAARKRDLRAALSAPFAELLWVRRQYAAAVAAAVAGPGTSTPLPPGVGWRRAQPAMAPVDEVLRRWRTAASSESMLALIDYLERALGFYRLRWLYVGQGWLLLTLLMALSCEMMAKHH